MKRILISGVSGLLGLNLALEIHQQFQVTGVSNQRSLTEAVPFNVVQQDLTQPAVIERLVDRYKPDILFHCAAMALPEACEENPQAANKVNSLLPGWIAQVCQKQSIQLVHISTDAVFDGVKPGMTEEDLPHPTNTYAVTKLQGEKAVQSGCKAALIARVNFFGWSASGVRSLAEIFFNTLSAGKEMPGFTDVFFAPLEVTELVKMLLVLVEKGCHGIYHVLNEESLSKYEFGVRLARRFNLDETLIKASSWQDVGFKARRSPNLILNVSKLKAVVGSIPDQATCLENLYQQWQQGRREYLHSLIVKGS
jgi:dTDP-4-dehydrorhamnose reductase